MPDTRASISIETLVHAPLNTVWTCWTDPEHIKQWNAASDDWHTPEATNDLRVGGEFHSRMEAKDKSFGFDFWGTYTEVLPETRIASTMGDGRALLVTFEETADGIKVQETFEIENENSAEMQRQGWQAILDRFKQHVEHLEPII